MRERRASRGKICIMSIKFTMSQLWASQSLPDSAATSCVAGTGVLFLRQIIVYLTYCCFIGYCLMKILYMQVFIVNRPMKIVFTPISYILIRISSWVTTYLYRGKKKAGTYVLIASDLGLKSFEVNSDKHNYVEGIFKPSYQLQKLH